MEKTKNNSPETALNAEIKVGTFGPLANAATKLVRKPKALLSQEPKKAPKQSETKMEIRSRAVQK